MTRPRSGLHTQISFLGFHSWNDVYAGEVSAAWWNSTITYTRLRPREILNSLSCGSSVCGHSRMRHTHRAAAPGPRLRDRHHLNNAQNGRNSPSLECPRRVRGSILKDACKVSITKPSVLVALEVVKRPLSDIRVHQVLEVLCHFPELLDCNGILRRRKRFGEQLLYPAFIWLRNGRVPWRSNHIRTLVRGARGRDAQR
jgi:hypothetical protein